MNFALVLSLACKQFEIMDGLIQRELQIVSQGGEEESNRLVTVMALAQSFVFNVSRAYRICQHGSQVLGAHPEQRKAFLRYIESRGLVDVRDVNEHGLDRSSSGKGRRRKRSEPDASDPIGRLREWFANTGLVLSPDIQLGPLPLRIVYQELKRVERFI